MPLSSELISQFVKVTKDEKRDKRETTVYGTVVNYSGSKYVRLDGSELLTPVTMTVDAEAGERVTVRLKNHTATVTGNITSPAARVETVKVVVDSVTGMEEVIADTVTAEVLDVERARIAVLEADNVTIHDEIDANKADIEILKAGIVDVDYLDADYAQFKTMTAENFSAVNADIESLEAGKLDVTAASSTYATITNLEATNALIDELQTTKLSATDIEGLYANIDFSNISKATMASFYANSGLIQNAVIDEATISGRLMGVSISGELIEAGTIIADKLVVQGEDGLYYALNTDGVTVEANQTSYNSLNGNVILAHSITASKITVDDLVAFGATIGGFKITSNSIYSGVKESVDNTTRGIYFDNSGQASFGNSSNYIKFYENSDGDYKLDISADSISFNNSGTMQSVSSAIEQIETTASEAKSMSSVARVTANDAKTVANTAKTDVASLTTRVEAAETNIIQNGNEISLRATKTELSDLENRVSTNEASITLLSNSISSNVTETTNLGTRMSTVEQASDELSVRLTAAESNIQDAAKTATNYLNLSSEDGLVVGDRTGGTLAGNIQLKAETGGASIAIRDGSTILSKFSAISKSFSGVTSATISTSSSTESSEDESGSSSETVTSASQTITSNQTKSVVKFESANPVYFSQGISTDGVIVNDNSLISNVDFTLNGRIFDMNGKSAFEPITSEGNLSIGYGRFKNATSSSSDWSILYGNQVKIVTKKGAVIIQDGSVAFETINSNGNMTLGYHLYKKGSGDLNLYSGGTIKLKSDTTTIVDSTGNVAFEAKNSNGNTVVGYARYVNSGNTNIYGGSEINLVTNSGWVVTNSAIMPENNAAVSLGKYNENGWSNIYIGNASGVYNGLRMIVNGSSENMCGRDSEGRYVFGNIGSIMYYDVKNVNASNTGTAFKFISGNYTASNNTTSVWLFGAADSTSRYIGSYMAYSRTYSSAANMVVTANGVFGRSTSSSERYKKDIVPASIDELKGLYDLPIKKFKYKNDYIAQDDELYEKDLYGFMVEDLETVLPCAVQHITDENGNVLPEMWNSNIIVPSLLKLIQDLNNRVKALEIGG